MAVNVECHIRWLCSKYFAGERSSFANKHDEHDALSVCAFDGYSCCSDAEPLTKIQLFEEKMSLSEDEWALWSSSSFGVSQGATVSNCARAVSKFY